jgi:hypothetical protein
MIEHTIATIHDVRVYVLAHDHAPSQLCVRDHYNRHTLVLTASEATQLAEAIREGAKLVAAAKERKSK